LPYFHVVDHQMVRNPGYRRQELQHGKGRLGSRLQTYCSAAGGHSPAVFQLARQGLCGAYARLRRRVQRRSLRPASQNRLRPNTQMEQVPPPPGYPVPRRSLRRRAAGLPFTGTVP
ncbi:MAG: hypothetical protein ACK53Y_10375, partial [bacterium]